MNRETLFEELIREVEAKTGCTGRVVVAGGAVRDFLLGRTPKDYDVFLLDTDYVEENERIKTQLTNLKPKVDTIDAIQYDWTLLDPLPFHPSEPFLIATFQWKGVYVQVMTTPCKSLDELLDTFDWNVSLFGYGNGRFITRVPTENIGWGKTLELQKVTFPLSTLRRGFRYSERFGMLFKLNDIVRLCEEVVKRGAS